MRKSYRIAEKGDSWNIAGSLAANGEMMPAVVESIDTARMAVGEPAGRLGRAV